MRLWVVLWLVFVAAGSVFTIVNWQVLTAQTAINLLVAQVTAPLGLVMLGAMAALTLLYLLFLLWVETKALIQIGRVNPRAAAEPASTPMTEFRTDLERQLGELRTETAESTRNVIARLEHVEQVVKDEVDRASHTLMSHVDRLEPHVSRAG